MEFEYTSTFWVVYDSMSDSQVAELDPQLLRVLEEHESAWARSGRVEGDGTGSLNSAWIVEVIIGDVSYNLYWEYSNSETVLFIGLVPTN